MLAIGFMGQELEISEIGLTFLTISSIFTNLVIFAGSIMAATAYSSLTFVIVGGGGLFLSCLGFAWFAIKYNLAAGYHHIKLMIDGQWKVR